MRDDELKTLDDFMCLPKDDLRYLGTIWAQFPQMALVLQKP